MIFVSDGPFQTTIGPAFSYLMCVSEWPNVRWDEQAQYSEPAVFSVGFCGEERCIGTGGNELVYCLLIKNEIVWERYSLRNRGIPGKICRLSAMTIL